MITINSALDDIMQLDYTSREILLNILKKRQIEARREQMASDAKKSIKDYQNGKLTSLSVEETIRRLNDL